MIRMTLPVPQDASILPASEVAGFVGPADFGNVSAEFGALRSKCGVYEMDRARVSLIGPDRVRWLNGVVTNNVRDLSVGQGVYAFLLSPQGRILGDLYAYNNGGSLLVDTDRSQLQKVLALFDRYIVMDEVEFSDITDKQAVVGVAGAKAREVLQAAGIEFPHLQPLNFVDIAWRNISISLVRGDAPCVESYEIRISPENKPLLLDALKEAGATPARTTALNMIRIAQGIPRYGQDIRERDLPQETQQDRALHFTKGCYIGQEIVERIRSRGNVHRNLVGFKVEGPLPAPGTKIQVEGKEVGEITSSAVLSLRADDYPLALGYIRREVAIGNRPIQIGETKLNVTSLPFTEVFKD